MKPSAPRNLKLAPSTIIPASPSSTVPVLDLDVRGAEGMIPGLVRNDVHGSDGEHCWVRGKTFYTLPETLWTLITKHVGKGSFNSADLELDLRLSRICGDHSFNVGFRDRLPIAFSFLRPRPIDLPRPRDWDCDAASTDQRWSRLLGELNCRRDYVLKHLRGYLGWLFTNPLFVNEHDDLWHQTPTGLDGVTFPQFAMNRIRPSELPSNFEQVPETVNDIAVQFRNFATRWRLREFAGVHLPVPSEPRMPDYSVLLDGAATERDFEGKVYIPDTVPLDGTGLVRQMLFDATHSSRPTHMSEWHELIALDNQGRKAIERYGRLFELQHFLRALHQRHASAFRRKKTLLKEAIAEYYGASVDTICDDFSRIRSRLATGDHRPVWLELL